MNTFAKITKTPVLDCNDVEQKRHELLQYFLNTFDLYESLFQNLSEAAYYKRADPLRHPLIFYLVHTAVFYINKFIMADLIQNPLNTKYEIMFAVGVDEMSWDDLNEAHYDWPTVQEAMEYRQQVRNLISDVIQNTHLTLPIRWEDSSWAIIMGIEHERIHLETATMLIRQLPLSLLNPIPFWSAACLETGIAPENQLLHVAGQEFVLGKKTDSVLYGWDNEYGYESVKIDAFWASQYLVSNQEFLGFIEDGGYQEKRWWTEDGWQWCTYEKACRPRFWIQEENNFKLRNMLEIVSMPWNWPVEINYFEAQAFCNWLAYKTQQNVRLPTEAEWYVLRHLIRTDQPNWTIAPGNINLEHYMSPCPVDKFVTENFYDVIGNVWQWTETHFYPFKGFKTHPYYEDFSTPTFDGKHNLIKGGSWISTGNEATYHARYAFRRHFYQYAGLRYVV